MVVGQVTWTPLHGSPPLGMERHLLDTHDNAQQFQFSLSQTTTGSAVEIEMKNGVTITRKTAAGLTLVGAFSADDNYYDGSYVYITYIDTMAVSHGARSATNTTSTTEVAFTKFGGGESGAVTDAYAITSIKIYTNISGTTLLATQAGETFGCGSTGALTMATVAATKSEATQLTLAGATSGGAVWGRYSGDDTSYDNAEIYIEYAAYSGEVKWGICTMDGADPTNEIIFYEATNDGDYTTTVKSTAITVRDFYRLRWMYASVQPKADANENVLLTDSACANIDGSGGDVWAMIEEAYDVSLHSRYHCPRQHQASVHLLSVLTGTGSTTNWFTIAMTYTPVKSPVEITQNLSLSKSESLGEELHIMLKPGTDFSMTVLDAAAAVIIDVSLVIHEGENRGAVYPAV